MQALALDLSTAVSSGDSTARSDGEAAPDGLLYTGGRDGLLCSWECSLPTKRRRRGYGTQPEVDEDAGSDSDLDDSDDERQTVPAMDKLKLNDLGNRPVSVASTRNRSPMPSGARPRRDSSTSTTKDDSLPVEERWEIDAERVQSAPAPKSTFRQAVQSHTDVSCPPSGAAARCS